jgi:ABC-type bacteriocin/lantibiotic exporter with double-glycine peptidase domain
MQEAVGFRSSEIIRYTAQALVAFVVPLFISWKLALVTMAMVPVLILSLTAAKMVGSRRAKEMNVRLFQLWLLFHM